jgi:hypothetical protein
MWSNKKYGKKLFKGSYYIYRLNSSERLFNLTDGKRVISFESWQAAKALGWVKV